MGATCCCMTSSSSSSATSSSPEKRIRLNSSISSSSSSARGSNQQGASKSTTRAVAYVVEKIDADDGRNTSIRSSSNRSSGSGVRDIDVASGRDGENDGNNNNDRENDDNDNNDHCALQPRSSWSEMMSPKLASPPRSILKSPLVKTPVRSFEDELGDDENNNNNNTNNNSVSGGSANAVNFKEDDLLSLSMQHSKFEFVDDEDDVTLFAKLTTTTSTSSSAESVSETKRLHFSRGNKPNNRNRINTNNNIVTVTSIRRQKRHDFVHRINAWIDNDDDDVDNITSSTIPIIPDELRGGALRIPTSALLQSMPTRQLMAATNVRLNRILVDAYSACEAEFYEDDTRAERRERIVLEINRVKKIETLSGKKKVAFDKFVHGFPEFE
eukprot:PhM_4_TR2361/c0_g1_i1/m.6628